MKCKYDGTGVWEGRCMGIRGVEPCVGHDRCKMFKPDYTTNADRIRAMSDEALAELLLDGCRGPTCSDQSHNDYGSVDCFKCRMDWLKQPVKDNDYKYTKIVTNYEFIKSMSMDKMAEMLTVGKYNFDCKECWELNGWTHGDQCDGCCKDYCLRWLSESFKSEELNEQN